MSIDLSGNTITSTDVSSTGVFNRKITRDGLVVYLDSMNLNSYPGNGTTWYDLSDYNNNGTLTRMNSPSGGNTSGYDTNTGYMMFDNHLGGSNAANNVVLVADDSSLDQCLSISGMTCEIWLKETSYICSEFYSWSGNSLFLYCSALYYQLDASVGGTFWDTGEATSAGNWRQVVGTYDGVNQKIYVNGIMVASKRSVISGQIANKEIGIGARANGWFSMIGALPIFRLYNRSLNSYEIAENFQANRGRFSL